MRRFPVGSAAGALLGVLAGLAIGVLFAVAPIVAAAMAGWLGFLGLVAGYYLEID